MPGGYSGYLDSLRKICLHITESTGSFEELVVWMRDQFGTAEVSSRTRLQFLVKAGLILKKDGIVRLAKQTNDWLTDSEDKVLIAVLHGRMRFVGEMLHELRTPKSIEQLRVIAVSYGLQWDRQTQIQSRRGWLESAKLIEISNKNLQLTQVGHDLLNWLESRNQIESPQISADDEKLDDESACDLSHPATKITVASCSEKLSSEILAASTDSDHSARFERAVRDGFRFMGFVAEHLGGSGKTDVLLTAPLGKGNLYRVAVDAKTTSSGALKDPQVDWPTLKEHRALHRAEYSLLVAPNPTGERLMERAREFSVSVLSAEQLASLCKGHSQSPLSLIDYKQLFAAPGEVDLAAVDERADQLSRLRRVASKICNLLPEKTDQYGSMSARDILLDDMF